MPENEDQQARTDPVMARLDDQIGWYSRAASNNRRGHWTLRIASLTMAAKHEKYLFLAGAGPYRDEANPRPMLAERIEALISGETTQWVALQHSTGEGATGPDSPSPSDT